jgi:hypothetical protein
VRRDGGPALIPPFDDDGFLPPGLHPASLQEVAERFGQVSELRRVQMESIGWMHDAAKRAGALRLVINGSFVTEVDEPNDVDCAVLIGPDFPSDVDAEAELTAGFPFLELQLVQNPAFGILIESFFATDRYHRPKGMIEVLL